MEVVTKEIRGLKFQIIPFSARKGAHIEMKLMSVLMPVITPLLGNGKMDGEIDFSAVGSAFQKAFGGLSEMEFDNLINGTIANCTYLPVGGAPVQLNTEEGFNKAFTGNLLALYMLIFEVMKVNKFCFLELVDGQLMKITGSSAK
jgi:hypothetical protein